MILSHVFVFGNLFEKVWHTDTDILYLVSKKALFTRYAVPKRWNGGFMKKKKILFVVGIICIILTGSALLPFAINATRATSSRAPFQTITTLASPGIQTGSDASTSSAISTQDKDNNETDTSELDVSKVKKYSGDQLQEHKILFQDEIINWYETNYSRKDDKAVMEIPYVYEYRQCKVGLLYLKHVPKGDCKKYASLPSKGDISAKIIVKKTIDNLLDVQHINLKDKAITITKRETIMSNNKIDRRYDVEVYGKKDMTYLSYRLFYSYDSITGEIKCFSNDPLTRKHLKVNNSSGLTKWPNTGDASKGIYGKTLGSEESMSQEEKNTATQYLLKINKMLLNDYDASVITKVQVGFIMHDCIELFVDMNNGNYRKICYSLSENRMVSYYDGFAGNDYSLDHLDHFLDFYHDPECI